MLLDSLTWSPAGQGWYGGFILGFAVKPTLFFVCLHIIFPRKTPQLPDHQALIGRTDAFEGTVHGSHGIAHVNGSHPKREATKEPMVLPQPRFVR